MIDQIEFSNIIVLNKIDMVKPEEAERITKILKTLNPNAEIYPTNYSTVPLSKVLNTHKFDFAEAAKEWFRFWNFCIGTCGKQFLATSKVAT